MATAMLPTPPEAPVTSTSPLPGASPFRSICCTASAAVKPAVPKVMQSRRLRPSGRRNSQSPGTQHCSA